MDDFLQSDVLWDKIKRSLGWERQLSGYYHVHLARDMNESFARSVNLESGYIDYCSQISAYINRTAHIARVAERLNLSRNTVNPLTTSLPNAATNKPTSLPDLFSPDNLIDSAENIAANTTLLTHNLGMLAEAAELESTHGGSNISPFFSNDTRVHHGDASYTSRKIGRIRRYNENKSAYSAWEDIYENSSPNIGRPMRTGKL